MLTLTVSFNGQKICTLQYIQGQTKVIYSNGSMNYSIHEWLRDGLVEYVGSPGLPYRRHTNSESVFFLSRLSTHLIDSFQLHCTLS